LRAAGVLPFDKLVGINPGSVWATKRWLPRVFAAVADRLIREKGAKVVFIGVRRTPATMQQILSLMKEKTLNWVGETSLKELIALIKPMPDLFDERLGALAHRLSRHGSLRSPFLDRRQGTRFFPYGSGHIVIEKDLPCRPCSCMAPTNVRSPFSVHEARHGPKKCLKPFRPSCRRENHTGGPYGVKILQMVDVPWDSGLAHYALVLSAGAKKEGHQVFCIGGPERETLA